LNEAKLEIGLGRKLIVNNASEELKISGMS
jgi:hypothetical protein